MDPSKKRMIIFGVVAVALLAYLYFPTEEDSFSDGAGEAAEGQESSGILGFFSSLFGLADETTLPAAAPAPPPRPAPTPTPTDVSEPERADFETVFSEKREVIPEVPFLINEQVWVALDKMDTWYADPRSVDQETLTSYLMHRKLWVRLAALQFVMATKIQDEAWLDPLQRQLLRGEHPSQARRFLRRVESIDPELYFRMYTYLRL